MKCPDCGEWLDKRDLDEVFKHSAKHQERQDIPYTKAVRIKRGEDAARS